VLGGPIGHRAEPFPLARPLGLPLAHPLARRPLAPPQPMREKATGANPSRLPNPQSSPFFSSPNLFLPHQPPPPACTTHQMRGQCGRKAGARASSGAAQAARPSTRQPTNCLTRVTRPRGGPAAGGTAQGDDGPARGRRRRDRTQRLGGARDELAARAESRRPVAWRGYSARRRRRTTEMMRGATSTLASPAPPLSSMPSLAHRR
jgi:hypothetical protein